MGMFTKATKQQLFLRGAIDGPSGSGKTYTGLKLATALCAPGKRVRVICTERSSARKYAHRFDFDVCELTAPYTAARYIEAIRQGGSDSETGVLLVDSLSHAWTGEGGALEKADQEKTKTKNDFTAWRAVSADHNKLIDSLLAAPCHVIVTMRTKMEYVLEENERGKKVPKKVGMKPVQREGMEYEFDVVMDMDIDHNGIISKTRCDELDGKVYNKPGEEMAKILTRWLTDGEPMSAVQVVKFEQAKSENNATTSGGLSPREAMKNALNERVGFTEFSRSELMCVRLNEAPTKDELWALIPKIKEEGLEKDPDVRRIFNARDAELKAQAQ